MNPSLSNPAADPRDARLDLLLARMPVRAREGFAAAVRSRIAAEDSPPMGVSAATADPLDARLDQLLAATPVTANAAFAQDVLSACRTPAGRRSGERSWHAGTTRKVVPFPLALPRWASAVGTFAALLAVAFLAPFQGDYGARPGAEIAMLETVPESVLQAEWELMVWADDLSGMEVLLDDNMLLILRLLTEGPS